MRFGSSLIAALLLAGCAGTSSSIKKGSDVSEVHLFGMPVTLNLDSKPGADGFAVRVYITSSGSAKGAEVKNGAVEVLMFDGMTGGADLATTPPTQTWKFSAADLKRFEEVTSLGHGYRFALRWTAAPKSPHITVLARYVPPKGEPIYSPPSAISSAVK